MQAWRQVKGFDHSARLLFDAGGHLTASSHARVKRRLDTTGHWSALAQSQLLAAQIAYPAADEIWRILMWNALPSPELAARLGRWMRAGMPLPQAGAPLDRLPRAS